MNQRDSIERIRGEKPTDIGIELQPTFLMLGCLGLLPFVFSLAVVIANPYLDDIVIIRALRLDFPLVFASYSAMIASFLAGSLWRQQFSIIQGKSWKLIVSNIVVVLVWISLVAGHSSEKMMPFAISAHMICFLFLLAVERDSMVENFAYARMRYWLTGAVVVMHLALLLAL